MDNYSIHTTRKPRGFQVLDPTGRVVADMRQPKLFSQDMQGTAEERVVRISSEGSLRMRYGVFVDDLKIGAIRTGGWGKLMLRLSLENHAPVELEFVHVGNWRERYHLRITKDLPLMEVRSTSRWKWMADHTVHIVSPGIAAPQMPLMLAIVGFCARLKRARAHAAAAT